MKIVTTVTGYRNVTNVATVASVMNVRTVMRHIIANIATILCGYRIRRNVRIAYFLGIVWGVHSVLVVVT